MEMSRTGNVPMTSDRSRAPMRGRGPRRLLTRLRADNSGAAMIEFALVSLPFFALLIASLQTSLVFIAQQNLETAAEKAGRSILTGSAQKDRLTQENFRLLVCSKLPSFMDCKKLLVDVRTVSSFSAVTNTSLPTIIKTDANGNPNNNFPFNMGSSGEIVIFRVLYLWPVQPGPLGFSLANSSIGQRTLVATRVFKQEPWI
jgi:Flp pilus assembly protein TadG